MFRKCGPGIQPDLEYACLAQIDQVFPQPAIQVQAIARRRNDHLLDRDRFLEQLAELNDRYDQFLPFVFGRCTGPLLVFPLFLEPHKVHGGGAFLLFEMGIFSISIAARLFLLLLRITRQEDDPACEGIEPLHARFVVRGLPAFAASVFKKPDLPLLAVRLEHAQSLGIDPLHLVDAARTGKGMTGARQVIVEVALAFITIVLPVGGFYCEGHLCAIRRNTDVRRKLQGEQISECGLMPFVFFHHGTSLLFEREHVQTQSFRRSSVLYRPGGAQTQPAADVVDELCRTRQQEEQQEEGYQRVPVGHEPVGKLGNQEDQAREGIGMNTVHVASMKER